MIDADVRPDAATPHQAVHVHAEVPRNLAEVARHLANAEAARREGRWLVQIPEADAALQADPHNVRARFLLGDGLISTGDLDHGCKYLHELGRNPIAVARAHAAGCPSD
jgi:hypothetical protein